MHFFGMYFRGYNISPCSYFSSDVLEAQDRILERLRQFSPSFSTDWMFAVGCSGL